jgi:hypothetical protein
LITNTQPSFSTDSEYKISTQLMNENICDGILGIPQLGVDGLDWKYTSTYIEDIINIYNSS